MERKIKDIAQKYSELEMDNGQGLLEDAEERNAIKLQNVSI